jgi:hypothetical protein
MSAAAISAAPDAKPCHAFSPLGLFGLSARDLLQSCMTDMADNGKYFVLLLESV